MDSTIYLKASKTQTEKARLLEFIQKRKYGYMPHKPTHLSVKCIREDRGFATGDGILRELIFTVEYEEKFFSFPVRLATPSTNAPFPAFIDISGHHSVPNEYLPAEEIVNGGFAVLSFCVNDIYPRGKKPCKLASVVSKRQSLSSPSRLMLWAYAARIVADYAKTLSYIDGECISVVGNGAFAHAALLALIFDSRLCRAFLNNPTERDLGSDGALDLSLFSLGYEKHVKRTGEYIYDEELLTSLAMPRGVFITRGELGLSLSFGELFKKGGSQGNVHCHLRGGTEYFSRKDWNTYIDFTKESALKNEI